VTEALTDWRRRSGRSPTGRLGDGGRAARPRRPVGRAGAGQVTLRWSQVTGACGYLVERADAPVGPFAAVDHGGGDVLAVPGPPYADTSDPAGARRWRRACTVADPDRPPSPALAGDGRGSAARHRHPTGADGWTCARTARPGACAGCGR